MRPRSSASGKAGRIKSLILLVLSLTSAILLVMMLPDLEWMLPKALQPRRAVMALAGLASVYLIARAVARRRPGESWREALSRRLDRVDAAAGLVLGDGLTIAITSASVAMLATWAPHYLLWPWGRDADTFATLAQSWNAGIRPYRDIRGYNFPGAIYLAWVLGKVFGWGRTWPLYAVDAAALIALGAVLAAWSRRCLGRRLPGLVSYYACLMYYLRNDYQTVAQRDWHVGLCVAMGLILLQGWPGRAARVASAMLAAAALSIRPHAVLFLPALASAVREGSIPIDEGDPSGRIPISRALAEWSSMLAVFTTLAFTPLIVQGLVDDLVRGLRIAAYGGPYSRADWPTAGRTLLDELQQSGPLLAIATLGVLLVATRGADRRRAVTWSLALGAALSYRLFHPVQHRYLAHPLAVLGSVALAPGVAWIVECVRLSALLRAAVVVAILAEVGPGVPRFCLPREAARAIATMARGQDIPVRAPLGAGGWFDLRNGRWYPWEDYRDTLLYLRASTSQGTPVANVLREPPFPSINGPAGRISPFRAESGVCWMWLVDEDLEPEFAAEIERVTDCVVVWSPGEHRLLSKFRLDRLVEVILRDYRRGVRFGRIEVWRRATPTR